MHITSGYVSQNCLNIIYDVQQEYALGRTFFLIHVKRQTSYWKLCLLMIQLYFISHKNIDIYFANMSLKFGNVSKWFMPNRLSLNADTTKW